MQNAENEDSKRTFEFACRIVKLYRAMWRDPASRPLAHQLVDAGTGIGSNLEEAEASQSKADFIAKCCA